MKSSGAISWSALRMALLLAMLGPFSLAQQAPAPESTRKVTNRVAPPYPELARAMNVKGSVRLEVIVAPNGTVKSVKVLGGHPVLAQAAERAVQKWQWERAAHESSEWVELRFNPD